MHLLIGIHVRRLFVREILSQQENERLLAGGMRFPAATDFCRRMRASRSESQRAWTQDVSRGLAPEEIDLQVVSK